MNLEIKQGDCLEVLKTLPSESINCCITSPPYWGLRDYGTGNSQIGLEPTAEEYVRKIVAVFSEVKRVLQGDGTLWLNLGDSYYRNASDQPEQKGKLNTDGTNKRYGFSNTNKVKSETLKPKDLVGIPWRVAFALQADGWYLRQDIIWHKPNPMPESVTDRCTKAHEYIFLMSKNPNYYFNNEAIQEPCTTQEGRPSAIVRDRVYLYNSKQAALGRPRGGEETPEPTTRNKRSVWSVNVRPYKEAHFATFPKELIEPCVLAGCPKDGTILDPFGGSGTTAEVAIENGRNAILIELNPEYIEIANTRISNTQSKLFC